MKELRIKEALRERMLLVRQFLNYVKENEGIVLCTPVPRIAVPEALQDTLIESYFDYDLSKLDAEIADLNQRLVARIEDRGA